MNEMLANETSRKLSAREIAEYKGPVHYISHHAVLKPDSESTPVRIVFNLSAYYRGNSLNEYWKKGPDLLNDILGVILRFRKKPVACVGDISKMFQKIADPLFRGVPVSEFDDSRIYGPSFLKQLVGAEGELRDIVKGWDWQIPVDHGAERQMKWNFILYWWKLKSDLMDDVQLIQITELQSVQMTCFWAERPLMCHMERFISQKSFVIGFCSSSTSETRSFWKSCTRDIFASLVLQKKKCTNKNCNIFLKGRSRRFVSSCQPSGVRARRVVIERLFMLNKVVKLNPAAADLF
ncbi:hypothetical protein GQR58_010040 [Nymphon striatum]|nr:hypothetical protein GQR58_010040 [Nymphon striatum]